MRAVGSVTVRQHRLRRHASRMCIRNTHRRPILGHRCERVGTLRQARRRHRNRRSNGRTDCRWHTVAREQLIHCEIRLLARQRFSAHGWHREDTGTGIGSLDATSATRPVSPVVIRFGRLGDMVLLQPLPRQLHRRFGQPCTLLARGPWSTPLYAGHAYVAGVLNVHDSHRPIPVRPFSPLPDLKEAVLPRR